jgi:hypothetical protein
LSAALVLTVLLLTYWRNRHMRRKNDLLWHIEPSDLKFDAEPEVLGSGSFGVVLLAEYRGTEVREPAR